MSRLRDRNDPANRLTWSVYYESQCPPVRVRIAWMRVDGLQRCQAALDGLTAEQQDAVRLAWSRLERGDAIGDIGACFTRVAAPRAG